ncbi:MAG: hypothetical protein MUF33_02665 [Candidatus Nanopelagicales bacterium]|nr:hypothetical protein [Candidatus Nanopelagicales bacterium]MCU0295731.1 hypothetical protein [Candidatus Nanopelagicales bacterium]MCU0297407.1 hypothetical protein [Candidatus Nanopelagicales bacterium]
MRPWVVSAGAGAMLIIGFAAGSAGTSGFTVASPPGVAQVALLNSTVTNSLRDQFSIATTIGLSGQVTDFNGGGTFTANSGPTWAADATWSNSSAGYVTRATGSGLSSARVPWLTRRSTVGVTVTSYGTSVNAGVLSGANASGTSGVAAVLYYSGSYRFAIFRIDGTTATLCSTSANLASTGNRTITLTYNPSTGDPASATITGTNGTTLTSNCSLSTANGTYAGLHSGTATTARYDNFSAVL